MGEALWKRPVSLHWGNFSQETYTLSPNSGQELRKGQVELHYEHTNPDFRIVWRKHTGCPNKNYAQQFLSLKVKIIVLEKITLGKNMRHKSSLSLGGVERSIEFHLDVLAKTWPPDGAAKYVYNIDKNVCILLNHCCHKSYRK